MMIRILRAFTIAHIATVELVYNDRKSGKILVFSDFSAFLKKFGKDLAISQSVHNIPPRLLQ